MDFDKLPEIAFLRIFDYLPLKDRFRVGRVSQSFRRISLDVNSRIKSLDLDDPMFNELTGNQFGVILRLCHHNLRDVKFCNDFGLLPAIFSDFTCPKLIDLDLNHNRIEAADFARIITNHPNLKRLKLWSLNQNGDEFRSVEFPYVTLSNLETLVIHDMDDETLELLVDRCPNLRNLEMTLREASSEDIWDGFFRSVPRLESLDMNLNNCRILLENLEWFWRMPLTSLTIDYYTSNEFMMNDDFIYKLIERFKNIECLDLWLTEASDGAVAALARLENLRVVKLDVKRTEFTDVTIREFSACRHLEKLQVYLNWISDQTFLELFRNCPRLRKLYICGVYDDEDEEDDIDAESAGMLLLELANVPQRPTITIEIRCTSYQHGLDLQSVWESIQVQNAVQHLRQNSGMEISIRLDEMVHPPPSQAVVQGDDLEAAGNHADGHQPDA